MADQDLASTGKDVRIELLLNGIPVKIIDQVRKFTEAPRYNEIETQHLGSLDTDIDHEPKGWEGEIELSRKSRNVDDLIDQYNFFRRNNIPCLITITRTKNFRNGTSVTHVYPDVKIKPSTESSPGSTVVTRLSWVCGTERI